MRILFFSNTPAGYPSREGLPNVGGWIYSILSLLAQDSRYEIAVVFLTNNKLPCLRSNNIEYFPISRNVNKGIRLFNKLLIPGFEYEPIDEYLNIVNKFNPTIINILGTEGSFVKLLPFVHQPVVVTIQGFVTSCLVAWDPPGFDSSRLFSQLFNKDFYIGNGPYHDLRAFQSRAKREREYLNQVQYYIGRTNYDKNFTKIFSPHSKYFCCNEILREEFYRATKWKFKEDCSQIRIVSILSDVLYKGFDLIIRTSQLLLELDEDFFWEVIGITPKSNSVLQVQKKFGVNVKNLNIQLSGGKSAADVLERLLLADLLVHPSYIENSSNSICEAQYIGCPLIATNVGGTSSLVQNGHDALMIPANDPFSLVAEIIRLKKDRVFAESISQNAIISAEKRHEKKRIKEDLHSVYEFICAESTS